MKKTFIKIILGLLLCAFFLLVIGISSAHPEEKGQTRKDNSSAEINKAENNLLPLHDELERIKRDQLNYQIEKDLLKEAYSTNIQTINIIISIAFGVVAVIAFFGVRGINDIKKEFKEELQKLSTLRSDFEDKVKQLESQKKRILKQFSQLNKVNEQQNDRLLVLELQEKIGAFIKSGNLDRALAYLEEGFKVAPNDIIFKRQKVHCLSKLGKFDDAIIASLSALESDPSDISVIVNLTELYALENRQQEYLELSKKYMNSLTSKHGPFLFWYFEAIFKFHSANPTEMVTHLKQMPIPNPPELEPRILGWHYAELIRGVSRKQDNPSYQMLMLTVSFLKGETPLSTFLQQIEHQK